MSQNIPRVSSKTKTRFIKLIDGVLSVMTLLFILKAVMLLDSEYSTVTDYLVVYLLFAASYALQAYVAHSKDRLTFVKNAVFPLYLPRRVSLCSAPISALSARSY